MRQFDQEEAERLVNTYSDLILRLSYTYLKSTHDAEDICQTVFLKLLTGGQTFDSPAHEKACAARGGGARWGWRPWPKRPRRKRRSPACWTR